MAGDRCAVGSELLRGLVTGEDLGARTCHLSTISCPGATKQMFKTINDTSDISLNFWE